MSKVEGYWPQIDSSLVFLSGTIENEAGDVFTLTVSKDIESSGMIHYEMILTIFDKSGQQLVMTTIENSPLGTSAFGMFSKGKHVNLGSLEERGINDSPSFLMSSLLVLEERFGLLADSIKFESTGDDDAHHALLVARLKAKDEEILSLRNQLKEKERLFARQKELLREWMVNQEVFKNLFKKYAKFPDGRDAQSLSDEEKKALIAKETENAQRNLIELVSSKSEKNVAADN
jgi:hypothetical protein